MVFVTETWWQRGPAKAAVTLNIVRSDSGYDEGIVSGETADTTWCEAEAAHIHRRVIQIDIECRSNYML